MICRNVNSKNIAIAMLVISCWERIDEQFLIPSLVFPARNRETSSRPRGQERRKGSSAWGGLRGTDTCRAPVDPPSRSDPIRNNRVFSGRSYQSMMAWYDMISYWCRHIGREA